MGTCVDGGGEGGNGCAGGGGIGCAEGCWNIITGSPGVSGACEEKKYI